jgi:hypothetical protein
MAVMVPPALLGLLALLAGCSSGPKITTACGAALEPETEASTYGFPEVVVLEPSGNPAAPDACSGTIVAPSVILTAGPCVDRVRTWKIRSPYGGALLSTASMGETQDFGDGSDNFHTLGLVYADTPMPLAVYPELASAPYPDGTSMVDLVAPRLSSERVKATGLHDATRLGVVLAYAADAPAKDTDLGGPAEVEGGYTLLGVRAMRKGSRDFFVRADVARPWVRARIQAHGGVPTLTSTSPNTDAARTMMLASDPCGSTGGGTWESTQAH